MTSNTIHGYERVKNIYVPRAEGADTDDEFNDASWYEEDPLWYRDFERDELFGRYEPIRELGTLYVFIFLPQMKLLCNIYKTKIVDHIRLDIKVK